MDDYDANAWINRFNFIEPLGEGGMGEVYLAEDVLHNNRQCVVKKIINEGEVEKLQQAWELVGVKPSATATDTLTPAPAAQAAEMPEQLKKAS